MKDKTAYCILVIEDNPGDQLLIAEYLHEQIEGPVIETAKSFKEAVKALEAASNRFNVVLLDLSLPDKNGDELINGILAHEQVCCPVIVLTGYTDVGFGRHSISLGVSDYLVKDDLTAPMLYKSMVYAIERHSANQLLQESEKKYTLLFDMSPQPMWVYDIQTLHLLQVNDAALKFYGYTKEEFLKLNVFSLHPPDKVEKVQRAMEAADKKENVFSGEFKQLKKSGELVDVEIYSTFLRINGKATRSVIAIDITERKIVERKVTQAIINTQEEERYEIGCELHDNVCQILASSTLHLSLVNCPEEAGRDFLARAIGHIKLATDEIRNLSHRLAPAFFDDTIEASFKQLLNSFNAHQRYAVNLDISSEAQKVELSRDLQLNLYRIFQEQLNNIGKHAAASAISVSLFLENETLRLKIKDNGKGFQWEEIKPGIGFANIKRRVEVFEGTMTVDSAPNRGCALNVVVPLHTVS